MSYDQQNPSQHRKSDMNLSSRDVNHRKTLQEVYFDAQIIL